jgi:hypothetical protein
LQLVEVKAKVAQLLKSYMGIDEAEALRDVPFVELHKDFDSLSFF